MVDEDDIIDALSNVIDPELGHIQITTLPAVNREEWKGLLQQSLGKKR